MNTILFISAHNAANDFILPFIDFGKLQREIGKVIRVVCVENAEDAMAQILNQPLIVVLLGDGTDDFLPDLQTEAAKLKIPSLFICVLVNPLGSLMAKGLRHSIRLDKFYFGEPYSLLTDAMLT